MFPVLFETKYISIQTLWVFIVIALLVGAYLAIKRLKRSRVNFNLFILHSGSFFMTALVMSRLFYILTHWNVYAPGFNFSTLKNFLSIWDQGLSLWGAVFGFLLMLGYRLWKEKEDYWKWFDALSIPFLVGTAIGNIGAFLGGYAYGNPTDMPWGVRYEVFSVRYTVPVHPTQIYAIILLIGLIASKNYLKKNSDFFKKEGNTTLYFSSLFFWIYFVLDFFRGDDTLLVGPIRISTILFAVAAISFSFFLFKQIKLYKSQHNEPVQTT